MRLEKISTVKEVAKPRVVKEGSEYKVLDVNGVERKVFEDIDLAKLWKKKHMPELQEGTEPVVYTSELMEGVLDATDEDGWMAKSQLYRLSKYAIELHGMIGDTDNLEPWVQAKITKASDYLGAVKHYMEYLAVNDYPEVTVVDDMPESAMERLEEAQEEGMIIYVGDQKFEYYDYTLEDAMRIVDEYADEMDGEPYEVYNADGKLVSSGTMRSGAFHEPGIEEEEI